MDLVLIGLQALRRASGTVFSTSKGTVTWQLFSLGLFARLRSRVEPGRIEPFGYGMPSANQTKPNKINQCDLPDRRPSFHTLLSLLVYLNIPSLARLLARPPSRQTKNEAGVRGRVHGHGQPRATPGLEERHGGCRGSHPVQRRGAAARWQGKAWREGRGRGASN